MVAQTIHAAVLNSDTHGEPFSFKDDGVHGNSGAGIVDNGRAYAWLIRDGFFVEAERECRTVIFPTKKLVEHLDQYLGSKGRRKRT